MLLEWQQKLVERLEERSCVSCWYVVPQTGLGKTWMAHHLSDARGALNTYPLHSWPLLHTVKAVRHYIDDNCSCGDPGYHRFENRPPGEPTQPAPAHKIVVFDMHAGCMLKHRLFRVSPYLASSHVVVLTNRPPDKATRALRQWEIIHLKTQHP
jgi:hypothetical protein